MPQSPVASLLILFAAILLGHFWKTLELAGAEIVATRRPESHSFSRAPRATEAYQAWEFILLQSKDDDFGEREHVACNLVCRARTPSCVCVELVDKQELYGTSTGASEPDLRMSGLTKPIRYWSGRALDRRRCLFIYADSLDSVAWRHFRRELRLDAFRPQDSA
ncbi:MAG: hypothetical protein AAF991_02690 [Pseudomonadota bacterium]